MRFMEVMQTRHDELGYALEGLRRSGTFLVQWWQDGFSPAGSDDKGLYYFVPKIMSLTGLPLDQAIHVFFCSLLFVGVLTGGLFVALTFKDSISRAAGILGFLLLGLVGLKVYDVYLAQLSIVAFVVPWLLWVDRGKERTGWPFWGLMASAGLAAGYCNFIRAQAGTGVLLFVVVWVLLNRWLSLREKTIGLLVLGLFTLLPYLHFAHLKKQRDDFLTKTVPAYESGHIQHTVWHSLYIGFGYLKNPYGIEYLDENAAEKVRSIDPGAKYNTPRYLEVLKEQVFQLVRTDPWFVAKTLAAKFLKVLGYALLFANIGLWFCWKLRPPAAFWGPFAAAGLFYSMAGVLVMPRPAYILGTIAMAAVFGIYMTGLGLEKAPRKVRS